MDHAVEQLKLSIAVEINCQELIGRNRFEFGIASHKRRLSRTRGKTKHRKTTRCERSRLGLRSIVVGDVANDMFEIVESVARPANGPLRQDLRIATSSAAALSSDMASSCESVCPPAKSSRALSMPSTIARSRPTYGGTALAAKSDRLRCVFQSEAIEGI
jgi:hypothetical protein